MKSKQADIEYAVHFGGQEIEAGFESVDEALAYIAQMQVDGLYADAYAVRYSGINQVKAERV